MCRNRRRHVPESATSCAGLETAWVLERAEFGLWIRNDEKIWVNGAGYGTFCPNENLDEVKPG